MEKVMKLTKYKSTSHLCDSRLGEGEHCVDESLHEIIKRGGSGRNDRVYASLKLDGSNVSIAATPEGRVMGFQRAGYPVETNEFEGLRLFQKWLDKHTISKMGQILIDYRIVGEWMIQSISINYGRWDYDSLFTAFAIYDIYGEKLPRGYLALVCFNLGISYVDEIELEQNSTPSLDYQKLIKKLVRNRDYSIKPEEHEGLVFRREIDGKEVSLVKWVRKDKVDGLYMPKRGENSSPLWQISKQELEALRI
jgi:hypothetical protein